MKKQVVNSSKKYIIERSIKPEYIYLPLEDSKQNKYRKVVKKGDYVYKNDVVAVGINTPMMLYSSISGYVREESYQIISNGEKVNCITIENDFKEKYQLGDDRTEKSYQKFIKYMQKNGIVSFEKLNINDKLKYLLVNTAEFEPLVTTNRVIIYNYLEDILQTIDLVCEILDIPKALIVVKNKDIDILNIINKHIKTYPTIRVQKVGNNYSDALDRVIIRNIFHLEYKTYPHEEGIISLNIEELFAIYEIIKYHRPIVEKIITVSGTNIKNRKNIRVKIGSLASEIIKSLDNYQSLKNPLLIVGGLFRGNSLPTDDVIITKDINSILVIENSFERSLPCIHCGKCTQICPLSLSPVFIMESEKKLERLVNLQPEKCIECGLCSYICPSRIELREFVKAAKERVTKI